MELKRLYDSSVLYIQTSVFEKFSMAALEAMAFSLPLVLTETVGISSFLKNLDSGAIITKRNEIEFANALLKLINDKNLRDSFGHKNKILASIYTFDYVANEYIKLINSIG